MMVINEQSFDSSESIIYDETTTTLERNQVLNGGKYELM